MKKAKVINKGKNQYICLPEEYRIDNEGIFFQEHELGILIVDPKKRWKTLGKVMVSAEEDCSEREDWTES